MLEFDTLACGRLRRRASFALCAALVAVPMAARAEPPAAEPARASSPKAAPASVPVLAYVLGAIGLSGLSVAATTGFLALDQKAIAEDHCSPTLRVCDTRGAAATDTGRVLRNVSTAGFIIGGLAVGLSAYLVLSAPEQRGRDVAIAVRLEGAEPQTSLVVHF